MTNLPQENSLYALKATLERFEERFAVLRSETYGEFRWPIKLLPDELGIGDLIVIQISTEKGEEEEKFATMRKLLEELIN